MCTKKQHSPHHHTTTTSLTCQHKAGRSIHSSGRCQIPLSIVAESKIHSIFNFFKHTFEGRLGAAFMIPIFKQLASLWFIKHDCIMNNYKRFTGVILWLWIRKMLKRIFKKQKTQQVGLLLSLTVCVICTFVGHVCLDCICKADTLFTLFLMNSPYSPYSPYCLWIHLIHLIAYGFTLLTVFITAFHRLYQLPLL